MALWKTGPTVLLCPYVCTFIIWLCMNTVLSFAYIFRALTLCKSCLSSTCTCVCCVHLPRCQIDLAYCYCVPRHRNKKIWNNLEWKMKEKERLHLDWIWDWWGSRRGQGHSRGKQSICLTHTLRDILCLQAMLFSSSSLEKVVCVCACVSHSRGANTALCIKEWTACCD